MVVTMQGQRVPIFHVEAYKYREMVEKYKFTLKTMQQVNLSITVTS